MTVKVSLSDGNVVSYDNRIVGEGKTLDRTDYWYNVNDHGLLRIWRRHLDGATWDEGDGEFTESKEIEIVYSPTGWLSVTGDSFDPDKR